MKHLTTTKKPKLTGPVYQMSLDVFTCGLPEINIIFIEEK